MFHLRALFDIFTGRKPVEALSDQRVDIKTGLLAFALAFFVTFFLLGIEVFVFEIFYGVMSKQGLVSIILTLVGIMIGTVVGGVILYVLLVVFSYIYGAMHYAIIKHYTNTPETLNDFNGALLVIFSSVRLVQGLLFLIPVIGWLLAGLVQIYSLIPVYKFIKNRFSLSEAKAVIVLLLPVTLLVVGLFVLSVIAAAFITVPVIGK
ncbi:MAG: hypothetical protein HY544_04735 [Candidatus Diapherotrites archaeon]|uniref:Yip1 domain-containing protein n=1 Tax=Candidatus Iainarchaeum sp. TaxID=3101447 RepID=A0A8T3YJS4_9ARCH|nr:hypothetical protein [Candidatus Diapherotrites archaeon]